MFGFVFLIIRSIEYEVSKIFFVLEGLNDNVKYVILRMIFRILFIKLKVVW